MTTARRLISRNNILILAGLLVVMVIVGSIWDHPVSSAIYDQSNPFGIIFAAYGEAPAFLAWAVSGTLLIKGRNQEQAVIGIVQLISGVLLVVVATAAVAYMPSRYLDLNVIVVVAIGVVIAAATVAATLRLSRDSDRRLMIRVACVLFIVPFLEMILINIVKIAWARPRMRMIEEETAIAFQSWWVLGGEAKASAAAATIPSEEFKSFPSGHTANAAVLILLTALVPLKDSLQKHTSLLLWIGAAWAGIVALSRIIMGAHFITDTAFGFAVTFGVILLVYQLVFTRPLKANDKEGIAA